jgi:membrane dipeptidase
MIESSPAALRIFFQLGARYLTLTHFQNVDWADSATDLPVHHGLTKYGERLVRELNRLGMFVDLSHVSADTMRDVLRVTRAPVLFSHSNAFAVLPRARNVPDDVLRMLPANGGVIHVNFIRNYVTSGAARDEQARMALRELRTRVTSEEALKKAFADWERANPYPGGSVGAMADHIDHIRKVAGIDHIGVGGDFFDAGTPSMVAGLEDVTRYPYLFAELLRRGYSDEDVLKIAGRNHLRAMRQMEQVAAQLQKSAPVLTTEGTGRAAGGPLTAQGAGSGMNSCSSPGTLGKCPARQSAAARSIRARELETKFHQMCRSPSSFAPPTSIARAGASASSQTRVPGLKMAIVPAAKVLPSQRIDPATT